MEETIVILQTRSVGFSWTNVEYFGAFSSPEEREAWKEANPLQDSDERYVDKVLCK